MGLSSGVDSRTTKISAEARPPAPARGAPGAQPTCPSTGSSPSSGEHRVRQGDGPQTPEGGAGSAGAQPPAPARPPGHKLPIARSRYTCARRRLHKRAGLPAAPGEHRRHQHRGQQRGPAGCRLPTWVGRGPSNRGWTLGARGWCGLRFTEARGGRCRACGRGREDRGMPERRWRVTTGPGRDNRRGRCGAAPARAVRSRRLPRQGYPARTLAPATGGTSALPCRPISMGAERNRCP